MPFINRLTCSRTDNNILIHILFYILCIITHQIFLSLSICNKYYSK
nr:MAG TPA: hypothetical protein [Caudoviricetes sp.]